MKYEFLFMIVIKYLMGKCIYIFRSITWWRLSNMLKWVYQILVVIISWVEIWNLGQFLKNQHFANNCSNMLKWVYQILVVTISWVEIWNLGQFLKNRHFANNCLIKVRIWECFCTHVTHIIVVISCAANFVSTKSDFS